MLGPMRVLLAILPLAMGLAPAPAPAQDAAPTPAPAAAAERTFTVPLRTGRLDTGLLLRALLEAYELDPDALPLPATEVDLRGPEGAAILFSARLLLLRTAQFERDLERATLKVTIDRERTREVRRRLRQRLAVLAGRLGGVDAGRAACTLDLPAALDPARPLVVLVHGLDSSPDALAPLHAFLTSPPHACQVATFRHPDDGPVDEAAAGLAGRLRALGAQPIAIVAHSMGGLVARACVEDPALDPGNVRALVLLGTPNQGSDLAALRWLLDARQAAQDAAQGQPVGDVLFERLRDGLGEAGGDLLPDSVFLRQLNARERNPRVRYLLVLGTRVPAGVSAGVRALRSGTGWLGAHPAGQLVQARVERWLGDLDEVRPGRGDGAVSVAQGRLAGVEPVLVDLDHLGLVGRRLPGSPAPKAPPLHFARIAEVVALR